jgi:hypothetical protein
MKSKALPLLTIKRSPRRSDPGAPAVRIRLSARNPALVCEARPGAIGYAGRTSFAA